MLAETRCASFKEKLIGVLSFHLLRSQKAILFITCEIWSENIDRRFFFLEQVSQTKVLYLASSVRG